MFTLRPLSMRWDYWSIDLNESFVINGFRDYFLLSEKFQILKILHKQDRNLHKTQNEFLASFPIKEFYMVKNLCNVFSMEWA